jgi:hypothetical protein
MNRDAWHAVGKMTADEAMASYVSLVGLLDPAFDPHQEAISSPERKGESRNEGSSDSSDSEGSPRPQRRGGGISMGPVQSTLAGEGEECVRYTAVPLPIRMGRMSESFGAVRRN